MNGKLLLSMAFVLMAAWASLGMAHEHGRDFDRGYREYGGRPPYGYEYRRHGPPPEQFYRYERPRRPHYEDPYFYPRPRHHDRGWR